MIPDKNSASRHRNNMFKLPIILIPLIALASARPQEGLDVTSSTTTPIKYTTPSPQELEQNRAARYQFSSDIEDHINDQTQTRTETRDGLKLEGHYSYSDGYHKRTVYYEADDKGFRVVKQEVEPLSGPKIDLSGTASVNTIAHGTKVAYKVQSVPVEGHIPKIVNFENVE